MIRYSFAFLQCLNYTILDIKTCDLEGELADLEGLSYIILNIKTYTITPLESLIQQFKLYYIKYKEVKLRISLGFEMCLSYIILNIKTVGTLLLSNLVPSLSYIILNIK